MPGGAYAPPFFGGMCAPRWSAPANGCIHRDKLRRAVCATQFSSIFAGRGPMGTDIQSQMSAPAAKDVKNRGNELDNSFGISESVKKRTQNELVFACKMRAFDPKKCTFRSHKLSRSANRAQMSEPRGESALTDKKTARWTAGNHPWPLPCRVGDLRIPNPCSPKKGIALLRAESCF